MDFDITGDSKQFVKLDKIFNSRLDKISDSIKKFLDEEINKSEKLTLTQVLENIQNKEEEYEKKLTYFSKEKNNFDNNKVNIHKEYKIKDMVVINSKSYKKIPIYDMILMVLIIILLFFNMIPNLINILENISFSIPSPLNIFQVILILVIIAVLFILIRIIRLISILIIKKIRNFKKTQISESS